ncbi:MAG: competence/damage-inducible protein A [Pseudomonadota bacterium]
MSTAVAIIIGDEILSGKIIDTNTPILIQFLRNLGISLVRIVIVSDKPMDIAEEVRRSASQNDYIFTSGGLGPTHDDRTVEGVALALDRKIVRHPEFEALIHKHMGDRVNDAALKMADLPEGSELIGAEPIPVIRCANVFMLPGVPEIFSAKLRTLTKELAVETIPTVHRIYLGCAETLIAEFLTQADQAFEHVKIGSYPRLPGTTYRVMVTVESKQKALVEQAMSKLLELLPKDQVLRVETDQESE